ASTEDDAIDEIRLFLNGKVLNLATRNLIVEDDKSKTATKKYSVSLLPGVNEIRAVALNTQRTESNPDIINVVYNNGAANTNVTPVVNKKANVVIDKVDKNATMHLVVVGINAYKNPKMNLNYALADATAFKDEVEKDAKTVISHVQTYFVTDDAADKTGITKAMQQVQQNAKAQDVFVFYYAGHGVVAGNKEFYLVPNDVTDLSNVDEALKEHGIAAKDLQQYAINIQAQKQLFILDACQSAAAFADMLSSDGNQQKNIALVARSTGTHWMAASGAQQFANEFATLGHGAFTYVLLQALKGEAANNKMITVDGLKDYMQNGVPALMKKYNGSQQTPASYGFGNDFPVEVIK
ncbi:MAG: caspase family protein, partial [Bacteroidetes bacterium]|nr:caspase family protein [Bacteroidota bacterium]